MRRLLIILLLTILPFQAALAAACAYCPDSCASESVTASEVYALDADALADDDCSRCQLGGAGILPSPALSHGAPSLYKLGLPDNGSFPASGKPDRPERPNWNRAA